MLKLTSIALGTLASFSALAWYPPITPDVGYEEISFEMSETGAVYKAFAPSNASIRVERNTKGEYDVDLSNFMTSDHNWARTIVTCSINTPSSTESRQQSVACYQVNGKPWIRIVTSDRSGRPVNAWTSTIVKWSNDDVDN